MSSFLPKSIRNLIEEFSKLPGIGPKSAERLTMHLLYSPENKAVNLAEAISNLKKGLKFCKNCWNISENELCKICDDLGRDKNQICVVEEILDVMALEKTREYKGTYHVLHGVLSPLDAIGPDELKIKELVSRVEKPENKELELILAMNPNLEGETTAMYLLKLFKSHNVRVTRIARGLPAGGDLDYADELTLTKALQGRAEYL